nr:cobyrinic acid a,c-diamide synthase [Klebsiella pneumoniae]
MRSFLRVPAAVVAKPPLRSACSACSNSAVCGCNPVKSGLTTGYRRHTAISGIASRNLDSFMLPAPILNALFTEQLQQADIAVIEG